ncbi:SLC13 family permease [Flintibacter sp. KGMB00164]|uniref:SLC13 family permease n=1 Tax=Flintibacter sp. KGMB00164 TaxID=2610895 RepID=UPI0012473CD3|nr:SLC13 family permease [Flintibacter sp. KGMB00164]
MSPSTITLLFLVFAIVMFVWEKIPLGLTAMICAIGLALTGVLDVSDAYAGFVNSNVVLCVAMFVVGQALFETGMANKIGGLVTRFAKTERQLIVAIMVIVGVMSGFLSNTGTAAVLIPVVIGIAAQSGYSRGKLLMPLVFAAALGGNLSIIGAPGNLMGVNALNELGIETGFFEYIGVGLPMLVAGILYFAVIGYKLLPDGNNLGDVEDDQFAVKDFSNVPKWKQITSLVVLIITIIAMIFEKQIGIALQVSASVAALFLILTGVISEKQALRSIDLKTVFLFAGSLALADALESSGAGSIIADTIINLLGSNPSPIFMLLVIFVVTCTLTNFMSNTATTALMVPIAVSLAQGLGADPRAVVVATVIAGSCAYATPIGMPANTMVVGIGGYHFRDYVKAGLPLILVSFVICMVLLPILFPFYP